jgi:RNA polymerase sigma-70 factor (ECF subfamily)
MDYERFATLVSPHTATLAYVASTLVGGADAEDAAQEALLRAWQGWPSLREAGAVRAWLLRITINVCHNWQAGRFGTQRQRTQPLSAALDERFLALRGPGDGDHARALDLRAAVAALPDALRIIVALRFYVGLDSPEIGAALDLPAATVRTRLRRALVLLRERLDTNPEIHAVLLQKGDS